MMMSKLISVFLCVLLLFSLLLVGVSADTSTDCTGTWVLNENLLSAPSKTFMVNLTWGGVECTSLQAIDPEGVMATSGDGIMVIAYSTRTASSSVSYNSFLETLTLDSSQANVVKAAVDVSGSIKVAVDEVLGRDESARTLTITGGAFAQDADLYAWLTANAVKQIPEPTYNSDGYMDEGDWPPANYQSWDYGSAWAVDLPVDWLDSKSGTAVFTTTLTGAFDSYYSSDYGNVYHYSCIGEPLTSPYAQGVAVPAIYLPSWSAWSIKADVSGVMKWTSGGVEMSQSYTPRQRWYYSFAELSLGLSAGSLPSDISLDDVYGVGSLAVSSSDAFVLSQSAVTESESDGRYSLGVSFLCYTYDRPFVISADEGSVTYVETITYSVEIALPLNDTLVSNLQAWPSDRLGGAGVTVPDDVFDVSDDPSDILDYAEGLLDSVSDNVFNVLARVMGLSFIKDALLMVLAFAFIKFVIYGRG